MKTIELRCANCGVLFKKPLKEFTRQTKRGRSKFFCSLSCAANKLNEKRKASLIIKICPVCNSKFDTLRNRKESTFCSRSCASKGSVTELRREVARRNGLTTNNLKNLISTEEALKIREDWKYVDLKEFLDKSNRYYSFEHKVGNYIYDLALFDSRLLVEFDSPYHNGDKQKAIDKLKDLNAISSGWAIKRIPVRSNSKIKVKDLKL
jgi:very-short-patch-repair endonuclease